MPQNEQIAHIMAALPGTLLGTMGWLGRWFDATPTHEMVWPKLLGGLMVSGFTGLCGGVLAYNLGAPSGMVFFISGICGAYSEKALDLLWNIAQSIIKGLAGAGK